MANQNDNDLIMNDPDAIRIYEEHKAEGYKRAAEHARKKAAKSSTQKLLDSKLERLGQLQQSVTVSKHFNEMAQLRKEIAMLQEQLKNE